MHQETLRFRYRGIVVFAVATLVLFLIAVGINGIRIGDLWVSVWAVLGIGMGFAAVRQLKRERSIVSDPRQSAATVRRVWHTGHKRGYRIEYEFGDDAGKRHFGSSAAPYPTPSEGQQIAVVYRYDQPSDNLPARQFWFHELGKPE